MVTLKTYRNDVRAARRPPTPKRKPARLTSEVARWQGHNRRKSKSR